MSDYVPVELRRLVLERAAFICEYCRLAMTFLTGPITLDHIIAFSLGGETSADNLACACYGCNQFKAARSHAPDPITGQPVPLFHPHQQNWNGHFGWNEDFTLMLGLTPTGRATIEALQLNRPALVNIRRLLRQHGYHPPG